MSSAFVIVDVQQVWAKNNPLTGERINAAANALRNSMPIIWVYMSRKDDGVHRVLPAHAGHLYDIFNELKGHYVPAFQPAQTDFIVTKQEANGFAGTNLDEFLKGHSLKKLYFAGFLSSQCVFSTAWNGLYLDYDSHIVMDLTSDCRDEWPLFAQRNGVPVDLGGSHDGVKLTTSRDIGLNLA